MTFLFYFVACLTIISALFVVLNRNPVYSAVMLVLCFFSIATLYLLLEAYFVAVLEIIIYAGAIMVLFLFVIMLLDLGREAALPKLKKLDKALSLFLVIIIFLGILTLTMWPGGDLHQTLNPSSVGDIKAVGKALFTDYLLPFEVASLLLLVALIGTVYLAKRRVK
jgi:NADH-quinone oxidoreductase subunit J